MPDRTHIYRDVRIPFARLRQMRRRGPTDQELSELHNGALRHLEYNYDSDVQAEVAEDIRSFFPDTATSVCTWSQRPGLTDNGVDDVHGEWVCQESRINDGLTCRVCNGLHQESDTHSYYEDMNVCSVCTHNARAVWSHRRDTYVAPHDRDPPPPPRQAQPAPGQPQWVPGLNFTPKHDPVHPESAFWRPTTPMPDYPVRAPAYKGRGDPEAGAIMSRYSWNPMNTLGGFRSAPGEALPLNPLWLGVELEVEPKLDAPDNYVRKIYNAVSDFAIIKGDGSLGPGGVEIVSVPGTLNWHRQAWDRFFDEAAPNLRSWSTGRCGIHVHISRAALTNLQAGRMIVFVNEPGNLPFIEAVAGRGHVNYSRLYKKRITDEGRYRDHYDALHTSARNQGATMELRIFRGNVRKEGFFRCLEFTHALCVFAGWASNTQLTSMTFLKWLDMPEQRGSYPLLAAWAEGKLMIPKRHKRRVELVFEEAA